MVTLVDLKRWMWRALTDILRVGGLVLLGTYIIVYGVDFAEATGITAFAPWSLFVGGAFYTVALAHIFRRILFPKLDIQEIALTAVNTKNSGAGAIFLGVCLVLAAFIILTGAMFRV